MAESYHNTDRPMNIADTSHVKCSDRSALPGHHHRTPSSLDNSPAIFIRELPIHRTIINSTLSAPTPPTTDSTVLTGTSHSPSHAYTFSNEGSSTTALSPPAPPTSTSAQLVTPLASLRSNPRGVTFPLRTSGCSGQMHQKGSYSSQIEDYRSFNRNDDSTSAPPLLGMNEIDIGCRIYYSHNPLCVRASTIGVSVLRFQC
jgi:hypothetical protein